MPIFDYYCTDCHYTVEILQKMNDPNITGCPACHQSSLVKQLSAPRIRLAGSGWYETDEKPKDKQRNIVQSDNSSAKAD